MNTPLLIIGKPHTSKSVFLAQFLLRLEKNKSKLSLYKPVADKTPISSVKESLAKGEEPQTTPTNKSRTLLLPVQSEDQQKFDLLCPEYGGEQINEIIETREVGKKWSDAIKKSDNWVFFIRLTGINTPLDISNITITENHTKKADINLENDNYTISEQSSLIELLQIFLQIKEHDYHFENSKVKLTIVLTCWDELETKEKPKTILEKKLPLFLNFVESNWQEGKIKVIGLSAQGFSLNDKKNKEKYQIEGPENFGYLVKQNGEKTQDITELVAEAL